MPMQQPPSRRLRRHRPVATSRHRTSLSTGIAMRAETQTVVEEIKQSVGLLRRHL